MSFLTEVPGSLALAAGAMTGVGAGQAAANAAAAGVHATLLPPALDEVSALVAASFQTHAVMFQATQAAGLAEHAMTVATLGISEGSYDATEAASALTML